MTLPSPEMLLSYLNSLGADENEVLESLRSQGVRGVRKKATDCPVTRGVRKHFRCDDTIEVSSYVSVHMYDTTVPVMENGDEVSVETPAPVREFIFSFDGGCFPDMEDN